MDIPDRGWLEVVGASISSGGNPSMILKVAKMNNVSSEVVMEGFNRALKKFDERGDGDLEEFTDWEVTPPGKLDLRVFNQDVWWVDVLRTPHLISDKTSLTDEHLENLLDWLSANVLSLSEGYAFAFDKPLQVNPIEWLEQTTLVRSLRAEAVRRGL